MTQRNTLFRQLAMLQLIPRAPHYCATSTIAAKLEEQGFQIDIRSIQRDLEKLSTSFPLTCNKDSKPYRWSFLGHYKSDLPALDGATALTMVLAEQTVGGLLPKAVSDQVNHKFQAARKYLDGLPSNGFAQWNQVVCSLPEGKELIPASINPEVWQQVTDALLNHYAINVEYLSRSKSNLQKMTLHPQGLVSRQTTTYLIATVNEHNDLRQFALHRIKTIGASVQLYRGTPDFNVREYVKAGAFGFPVDQSQVILKALITPELAWKLAETPISEEQTLSDIDADGWVHLEATVPNDQQTLWWIMGYGANIHVIKPNAWREHIWAQAEALLVMKSKYPAGCA